MSGLAAVSVDLDSLPHYCRIHGLPESLLDERARALVYTTAVPRFLELFERLQLPATLFAIGEDLDGPEPRASLRAAVRAGLEVGSHSHRHDYRLSRLSPAEIAADLAAAEEVIREATGVSPEGFRAPGYALSPALYQAVCARGYRYDSSTFPAAPYYLAKAAVMGALWVSRRPSKALLDTPRVLGAPRVPYHPDPQAPYRRGRGPVLELPIAVSPWARMPFIGTFALTFPRAFVRAGVRSLRNEPLFNFELHAVDLLDASDGIPAPLVQRQKDLAVPYLQKRERLEEVLGWMMADRIPVTLAEAARQLAGAQFAPPV